MKQVYAYINHARWLVCCPIHTGGGKLEVDPAKDKTFICPVCHPGILASFTGVRHGRIASQPDTSARRTARLQAEKTGDIYEIVYPENRDEILAQLQHRPLDAMNWKPGEAVELLTAENIEHRTK